MSTTVRQPSSADQRSEPLAPPADLRLGPVWDALSRPDVKVVSTDVFDTLVWRQVPEPVDAFPLVGARLRRSGDLARGLSDSGFAALRREAESVTRAERLQAVGESEITLGEIYARLPPWVFAHRIPTAAALEVELAVERDLVVPDLDVVTVLLEAKRRGKRLIAVSDTYFSRDQLQALLRQPVLSELGFDAIFTSSDHRLGKSGGLYDIVLSELAVRPEAVVHFGDNHEADIHYPSELGIACHAFERRPRALSEVLPAERRLARTKGTTTAAPPEDVARAQTELTALRGKVALRAEGAALPPALRPFWEYGAVSMGPVFTGFAEWVQERALDLGATHLHCFMREGGFLGELIGRAGDYMGTGIATTPLWLNREVLSRASIATGDCEELEPLLVRRRTPTVERFIGSIGVSFADLPRFAAHADTRLDDPTTRHNLLEAISEDEAVRAKVVDHARRARDRVVRYVEGLLDGNDRMTVVDLGWAASAQGLLSTVLAHAGLRVDVSGLYLALHRGAAQRVLDGAQVRGYLGEYGEPAEAVDLFIRSPEILEQICMPDHASQCELSEDLQPVFGDGGSRDRMQSAESDAVRKGIGAFQREWSRYHTVLPGKLSRLAEAADLVRPMLMRSVVSPTEREAATLGSWLHDENQGSTAVEPVAADELVQALRHLDPDLLRRLPMQEVYWPFGLAARVDRTWGDLMTAAAAGEIPWEALSGDVDTGRFKIAVAEGTDVPGNQRTEVVPKRNRFGLSHVRSTLAAPAIREIELRPTEHPAVLRMDFLEVRCHVQGRADPVVIRLDSPQDFARLRRVNCFVLNPNVFVVHSSDPVLVLDLVPDTGATVFRVDIACGFAALAISELLPTPGRLRSVEEAGVEVERLQRHVEDLKDSVSWRVTKPLRTAKRIAGR